MVPESGFSRPSISFRMVDLPAPLAPRKILVCPARTENVTSLRITFSSNDRTTLSNSTTGACGSASSTGNPKSARLLARIRTGSRSTTA